MRRSSIILAIASVVAPFGWAYLAIRATHEWQSTHATYICGLQTLATIIFACLGSSVMSAGAFVLGAVAFCRLPAPRPLGRRLELASLALPLIVFGTYASIVLFG